MGERMEMMAADVVAGAAVAVMVPRIVHCQCAGLHVPGPAPRRTLEPLPGQYQESIRQQEDQRMTKQAARSTPTGAYAERRAQLFGAADAYVEALAKKDFSLIPYAENVVLRAPVAPGGVHVPLVGREALRS